MRNTDVLSFLGRKCSIWEQPVFLALVIGSGVPVSLSWEGGREEVILIQISQTLRDFPGGPVVKTPHLQCRGQGTKIPHAARQEKKKKITDPYLSYRIFRDFLDRHFFICCFPLGPFPKAFSIVVFKVIFTSFTGRRVSGTPQAVLPEIGPSYSICVCVCVSVGVYFFACHFCSCFRYVYRKHMKTKIKISVNCIS